MFKRWSFRTLLLVFLLSATVVMGQQTTPRPPSIAIIMDASGSMQALLDDGRSRLAVAKEAIIALSSELQSDTDATLWVYGHRLGQSDPAASCLDIEQVIPVGMINAETYEAAVTPLNAIGYTPIATTLQMAADSLPPNSPKLIVLMSDGEESCGGDPCAVAQNLAAGGFDLVVNTIGFAADAETRAQLQCIADVTNGTYYEAQDSGALIESLRNASAPAVAPPTEIPTSEPPTSTPLPTETAVPTSIPTPEQIATAEWEPELALPFDVARPQDANSGVRYPQALLDGDQNLHIIWTDMGTRENGTGDIFHRVRSPEGFWSPVTNLSEPFAFWIDYKIARANDGSICVYMSATLIDTQPMTVQVRCLTDGAWRDPVPVDVFSQAIGNYVMVYDASDALQGIYNNSNQIYFARTGEVLGEAPYGPTEQFVIDAAGGYHLVWSSVASNGFNYILQYRYSPDGITWEPQQTLTLNGDEREELDSQLVADTVGNVHLLFTTSDDTIEYRKWTPDGGWGDAVVLSDIEGSQPELAVDSNGLAVAAWHIYGEILYAYQLADGSWTEAKSGAFEGITGTGAALAVDTNGTIHLVWHERLEEIIRYTQLER